MKIKQITHPEKAIEVLKGAGVILDMDKKVQYWTLGMKVTKKIAHAGSLLDAIITGDKREWNTVWMHTDNCACRDCIMRESTKVADVKRRMAKAAAKKEATNVVA